ncbi:MAG: hypothetical protein EU551_04315 [Promethearchaeota archaeon]|nr:MAG: hypothetical protein EU551_04315 [Candidatus Lokiarchaeota archaeon]
MGTLNIDMIMSIPRAIELVVYLTCAIIIYRKRDYYLNKVYAFSLIGWSLYVICDILIFPIGHFEPYIIMASGEPGITYPLIANILRDFQVLGGLLTAFGYIYASIVIRYGVLKAKEKKTMGILIIAAVIFSLIGMLNDGIIRNVNETPQVVQTDYKPLGIAIFFVEITLFFIAVYEHIRAYREIDISKPEKRRIMYFIFGSVLIAAGVIYFIIIGQVVPGRDYQIITGPIGHAIWILSPLCILYGFRKAN